jgi:hypothetical protein
MLSISNFDEYLKGPSLTKGKKYFTDGHITDLEDLGKGLWSAEVEGTEIYNVDIDLKKDNTINECFCDCPHDDDYCKHIIATLYAIRDIKTIVIVKSSAQTKKLTFSQLLKKVSEKELLAFVKEYGAKSKEFKLAFEFSFAQKDENYSLESTYNDVLLTTIKKYYQRGYINYKNTNALAKELNKFLNQIKKIFTEGNLTDAFKINTLLLKQLYILLPDAEDHEENLSNVIYDIFDFTTQIFDVAPIDLKESIFQFLTQEINNKSYFAWEDRVIKLLSCFKNAALFMNKHEEYLSVLNSRIAINNKEQNNSYYAYYLQEKLDFLEEIGNKAEAAKIKYENLDILEFRQKEVELLIKNENYAEAKILVNEGIKIASQKKHGGTVSDWNITLLKIAQIENDLETIRVLAKQLTYDRGWVNMHYYKVWKSSYDTTVWVNLIEEHINNLILELEKNKNSYNMLFFSSNAALNTLAPIYIEEKYFERLWLLLKKGFNLGTLLKYHEYIFKDYKEELLNLYIRCLNKEAEIANTRNLYITLAYNLEQIAKFDISYSVVIQEKVEEFKEIHKKRPAFLEELESIKFS